METARVKTAKALGKHIKQSKLADNITARDVQRKQWSGLKTALQVEAALAVLESFHWVIGFEDSGVERGRPTTRYAINPLLHEKKSSAC